jgi:hypothetical protein
VSPAQWELPEPSRTRIAQAWADMELRYIGDKDYRRHRLAELELLRIFQVVVAAIREQPWPRDAQHHVAEQYLNDLITRLHHLFYRRWIGHPLEMFRMNVHRWLVKMPWWIEFLESLRAAPREETFTEKFVRLFQEARLEVKEVATEAGVVPTTVLRWLAGAVPSLPKEKKLAAYLTRKLGRTVTFGLPSRRPRTKKRRAKKVRKTLRKTH